MSLQAQLNWLVYHYLLCFGRTKEAFVDSILSAISSMHALGYTEEPLYEDYTKFICVPGSSSSFIVYVFLFLKEGACCYRSDYTRQRK